MLKACLRVKGQLTYQQNRGEASVAVNGIESHPCSTGVCAQGGIVLYVL